MTPGRAAVHVGTSTVRVAAVQDGVHRVVEVAADTTVPLTDLLAGLLDDAVEIVSVADGPAGHTGAVAAATAVAGARETVVVDVGHGSSRAYLVRGGVVVRCRSAPGGARLDAAVAAVLGARCPSWVGRAALSAEARRVREALSLQPEATAALPGSEHRLRVSADEVRAALREPLGEIVRAACLLGGRSTPVLLVGGGARAPQLAQLCDLAGLPDVTVAGRPDAAAVLGALAVPGPTPSPTPRSPAPPRPSRLPAPSPVRWRPGRVCGALVATAVGLGALHMLGGALTPQTPTGSALPSGVLAQYDYRLDAPPGWAHTGGLPERRRSLLTPTAAPDGSDLIAVESTPLGYDADAEPQRAAAELRAEFDAAAAGGAPLTGYEPARQVGGRTVVAYREQDGTTVVRWYVVLDGHAQLSVGCRHTPTGAVAVGEACAWVVASIRAR